MTVNHKFNEYFFASSNLPAKSSFFFIAANNNKKEKNLKRLQSSTESLRLKQNELNYYSNIFFDKFTFMLGYDYSRLQLILFFIKLIMNRLLIGSKN